MLRRHVRSMHIKTNMAESSREIKYKSSCGGGAFYVKIACDSYKNGIGVNFCRNIGQSVKMRRMGGAHGEFC